MSIAHSSEEAKDIVSETVLIAYENFDSVKEEKAFLSYLFTIAYRNKIKYDKMYKHPTSDSILINELLDHKPGPEDLTDIRLLYEAIDKLSSKTKDAIILAEIVGLSHKEIAKIQETSTAVIKVRVYRGKKKLASLLGVTTNTVAVEKPSSKLLYTMEEVNQ
jgi:RNA polymerase sigma-70 factor (ECF subfamily)